MFNNVIDLIVRMTDQFTGPSQAIVGSIKRMAGAFVAAFSFGAVIANTKEAQAAVAQLNVAFDNSVESANRSKKEILEYSSAAQAASTFSDEAVTRAQTALLRFNRVTGPVFERTRDTILDVASALNVDLETAAVSVGRALQSPVQGLRQLRSLGVIFTEDQKKLIKSLTETGKTAEAQRIILDELASKYGGAAEAARNTLGGALEALKHAFGDLFESTDRGANKATDAINGIADQLNDPEFKANIQEVTGLIVGAVGELVRLINEAIKGWKFLFQLAGEVASSDSKLDDLYERQAELSQKIGDEYERIQRIKEKGGNTVYLEIATKNLAEARKELEEVQRQLGQQGAIESGAGRNAGTGAARKGSGLVFVPQAQIDQENADALDAYNAQMEELTKNMDMASQATKGFEYEMVSLPVIFSESLEQTDAELDALQKNLEETVTEIPKIVDEALERTYEPIDNFVNAFKNAFDDILATGHISIKSFVRSMILELGRKEIFKAIERIGAAMKRALSTSGSSGGFWGGVLSTIGGLFGAAGGGLITKPTIVGEEGPELAIPLGSTQIFNRRQLAAMGGGGGASISMPTYITITGSGDRKEKEETAAMFRIETERNNAKMMDRIARMLFDNGFGRMR